MERHAQAEDLPGAEMSVGQGGERFVFGERLQRHRLKDTQRCGRKFHLPASIILLPRVLFAGDLRRSLPPPLGDDLTSTWATGLMPATHRNSAARTSAAGIRCEPARWNPKHRPATIERGFRDRCGGCGSYRGSAAGARAPVGWLCFEVQQVFLLVIDIPAHGVAGTLLQQSRQLAEESRRRLVRRLWPGRLVPIHIA